MRCNDSAFILYTANNVNGRAMLILHVDTGKEWRGGQRQALLLHEGLLKRHISSCLLCRKGGIFSGKNIANSTPIDFAGEISPSSLLSLRKKIKELKPDIVHSHDAHSLTPLIFLKMMGHSFKIVHTRRVDFSIRKNFTSIHKYRNKYVNLVSVSKGIKDVLVKDGIGENNILIIHDGVPKIQTPPVERINDVKKSLGLNGDGYVLGNVASLASHKDHINLLRAFKVFNDRFPNSKLLIAGQGECLGEITAERSSLKLEDKVILTGFRTDIDVLMHCFDMFVMGSYLEGLNTSIIDAMSIGLPVVATDTGGIPELVEDGVTGYLAPPRNSEALGGKMVELITQPDKMKTFGINGAEKAKLFTDDTMTEKYIELYKEILA